MEWHTEFRAYARAFGRDEVAAILLRDAGREWIVWPAQLVEGLTFTLDANAILDTVPGDALQHVVGWVHSHPLGMDPSPSGTDDGQIRELARDLGGRVAEMWIFGGHDYSTVSVTRAVSVEGCVYVSDLEVRRRASEVTPWDDAAAAFYDASCPAPTRRVAGFLLPPKGWDDDDDHDCRDTGEPWYAHDSGSIRPCSWCFRDVDGMGALCEACDDQARAAGVA